jgi:putative transposase
VVADQLRGRFDKIGSLMDAAEHEAMAYMDLPKAHWLQIHSTNPLQRLNAKIKRHMNVMGIFPKDRAITHPAVRCDAAGAERRVDPAASLHAA